MIDLLLLITIFLLLFMSGYLSSGEAAFFSLPLTKIKTFQFDPNPAKQLVASLLKRPRDLLVTIFMLNTAVNILLQNAASSFFGEEVDFLLKVGAPLVLTLLFGEILPKYIGLQHNVTISQWVAKPLHYIQQKLRKVQAATMAITVPISRILFFYLKKEPEISKEELAHILKTSEEHGVFSAEEGGLLAGYLQLQDWTVKDVMRPREDILFYNIQEPLSQLNHLFVDLECSKLPICDGGLEKVLGTLSSRQYLIYRDEIKTADDLHKVLAKPIYIPETTDAILLLKRFSKKVEGFALVVDEYGSVSGLITEEDLIEVIIGEITDLRDLTHLYTKAGSNEIIASGKMDLSEFNDFFKVELTSPNNMVTIGGWLMERLGEVPKVGTKCELEGFLFQILAGTQNRIRRIYIRKVK